MAVKDDTIRDAKFNLREEVISAGSKIYPKEEMERFKFCLQCGKCTGGCPSGRRTNWRIRKIFEEVSLGQKEEVFSDEGLWMCTTCYTCQERCPHGIHTTDMVRVIRNLAVKSGHMKEPHRKTCLTFFTYGHAVPINEEMKGVRKKMGMDEMPPTAQGSPEALKEVNTLVEKTGFKKMVEDVKK